MPTISADVGEREAELARFIDGVVAELQPLAREHNEAEWQANLTGEPRHQKAAAQHAMSMRRLFARRDAYEYLRELSAAGGVADPQLARQMHLLLLAHEAQQMPEDLIERIVLTEKDLEGRFNAFRATLDGRKVTDNEIKRILRVSKVSAEREAAWVASKQIGAEVAADLVKLVKLRNEGARAIGHSNYYSMMLTLDELDETELFSVLDELDRGTREPFAEYKRELDDALAKRFGITVDALRPWHYADPFFQEAPPGTVDLDPQFAGKNLEDVTRSFYAAVGFDIEDLLRRADLYERPGKCQHAFCLCVDRGDDIRVLCNNQSDESWMSTMLHEFGHAVYDKHIDAKLPWLLRDAAHTLTTESSAMLFDRLTHDPDWLELYAGMPAAEARRAAVAMRAEVRAKLLVLTRWCLLMCHMERALYRDPDQDLDTLWWDLAERFQMIRRPQGRRAPDWASKIHFTVAPVYYQNYMLGEMMASQIENHLLNVVLGGGADVRRRYVTSPDVGTWLKASLYGPGRSRTWQQTLESATGSPLSAAAFVSELALRS